MTNTTTPSPEDIKYATDRAVQSMWYAWGWMDARGISDGHGHAITFGECTKRDAIRYRTGEVTFLPSIMDQWATYRAANGVEAA